MARIKMADDEMVCEGSQRVGREVGRNGQPWVKADYQAVCKVCENQRPSNASGRVDKHVRSIYLFQY